MKGAIFRAKQLSPFFLLVDTRLFFAPAKNELEFKEKAGQSTKILVGSRRKNRKMIKNEKTPTFSKKRKKNAPSSKIKNELNWTTKYSLENALKTAWNWELNINKNE